MYHSRNILVRANRKECITWTVPHQADMCRKETSSPNNFLMVCKYRYNEESPARHETEIPGHNESAADILIGQQIKEQQMGSSSAMVACSTRRSREHQQKHSSLHSVLDSNVKVTDALGKWCPSRREWSSPPDVARRVYSSVFLGSPGEYPGFTLDMRAAERDGCAAIRARERASTKLLNLCLGS
ncbi:unnamed protein product [Chrysodeixis includens]|uniref:Uncharacterized protein n=1 Tax=Chrysodeixis includens TaxID=689277 RepID=A0A9N8PZJ7_CHRIL|nr:unnamed protein product [Chrysodeixis includens]